MIRETPFSIGRLKIYFRGSKTDAEKCLITSEEISSYPELFFVLVLMLEGLLLTCHPLWLSPLRMGNARVKSV